MTLLHFNASMFRPSPRIVATGAFACAAKSWRFDSMGYYRPLPRGNIIA